MLCSHTPSFYTTYTSQCEGEGAIPLCSEFFFSSKLYFHGNGSSLFLPINSSHTRIEKLYDRNTHMHTSFRVTQAGSYECVYHPHPLLLLVNKLNGIKFAIVGVVASLCVAPS